MEWVAAVASGYVQRTIPTSVDIPAKLVGLRLLKVGKAVGVRPASSALGHPPVKVESMAADVDLCVVMMILS